MGRYRAPRPPSAKYITPEGATALRRELDELWRVKRPAVTRAVAEAAAQGDRSENAEYIYGKKQLAEIDRRVRFLRKRLTGIRVVDTVPSDTSKVFFGAWFELRDADGQHRLHRLVGPDEFDFAPEYLSVDSPLGRAMLGKAVGATVIVEAPEGERHYEILTVRYGAR
jgi:transcription elongation factor GreB